MKIPPYSSLMALSFLTFATSCQPNLPESVAYPSVEESSSPVVDEAYRHKYGFEVDSKEWQNRGEHGQKVSTLKNGVTVIQNFHFGKLDGDTTYSFPYASAVERVETFKDGVLVVDMMNYTGQVPKKKTEYLKDGYVRVTQWYENGTPHSIEELDDGKLLKGNYFTSTNQPDSQVIDGNGTRTNRDSLGQLTSLDTIENGEMIERISYWPNGTPKEMLPFKAGLVHGLRRTFYVGGEPDKVEQWVHGAQNGITIIYQNGEKYAEVPYINGSKNGIEKRYRNGTELFQEINWVDGQERGPLRTYKPNNAAYPTIPAGDR